MAEQDRGQGVRRSRRDRELTPEELERQVLRKEEDRQRSISDWIPKTEPGRLVKSGQISSMEDFFTKGYRVMEPQIVDALIPAIKEKLVHFTKTARITRQGRSFSFRASVLVGDGNAFVGLGIGSDRERIPAIEKATRQAKMAMKKVRRGCGSWECRCKEPHSIPFEVEGNSSSVRVRLLPAPKGTGLVVGNHIKEVLQFAGVRDVWSKTRGSTATTLDFVSAAVDALAQTSKVRFSEDMGKKLEVNER